MNNRKSPEEWIQDQYDERILKALNKYHAEEKRAKEARQSMLELLKVVDDSKESEVQVDEKTVATASASKDSSISLREAMLEQISQQGGDFTVSSIKTLVIAKYPQMAGLARNTWGGTMARLAKNKEVINTSRKTDLMAIIYKKGAPRL